LWDKVFADGEHEKGSIYLIRKGGMLTDMDEYSFTVTVRNDMTRRQTERSRALLEELMEFHTGKRRTMRVVINESPGKEISVDFGKNGKYEIYLLDENHSGELVSTTGDLTMTLKNQTVVLIKEI
jgi:hypothetical protein